MPSDSFESSYLRKALRNAVSIAADWITEANALVIAAGAGMGVDSGLPDFRGNEGFWKAYPALGRGRIPFEDIANPAAFERQPELAWGFYGHRLTLYRQTVPHQGFGLLADIGRQLPGGTFAFTSNVDGQFQRAGFDPASIVEVHGSIHHLQCQHGCMADIWSARDFQPRVDAAHCTLIGEPPRCPHCAAVARPNILMFGDWKWLDHRTRQQQARYNAWYRRAGGIVTIELGAGVRVATVRRFSETTGRHLVRINPQSEPLLPSNATHLRVGALAGIRAIYAELVSRGFIATEAINLRDPDVDSLSSCT